MSDKQVVLAIFKDEAAADDAVKLVENVGTKRTRTSS